MVAISAKRQKLSSRNNNPNNVCFSNFPRDILINILSKLPSKTILDCKCVCKVWHETVLDPSFAQAHYDHMVITPSSRVSLVSHGIMYLFETEMYMCNCNKMFIIEGYKYKTKKMRSKQRYRFESTKLNLGHNSLGVVNSCRGFLLLRGDPYFDHEMHKRCFNLYVYNPLTNELCSVPKVIMKHDDFISYTCGLGFSPVTKQYKVVCFLVTNDIQEFAMHTVQSNSNNGVWRWLEVKDGYYKEILEKIRRGLASDFSTLALNGVIHWLVRGIDVIACFDVEKEEFYVMPSPCVEDPSNSYVMSISTLNGLLCIGIIVTGKSRHGEIWVMGKYGVKESWTKYVVLKEDRSKRYMSRIDPILVEVLDNGEMVLLSSYYGCLLLYDPSTEYSKRLRVPGVDKDMRMQLYVPSFFSIGN